MNTLRNILLTSTVNRCFSQISSKPSFCLGGLATRSHHTSEMEHPKVAVVLAGCGVYDGTEIHEASAALVHLSRADAAVSIFAPNIPQMHVIDHTKGAPAEEKRNVLCESARIARGNIKPLTDLVASNFDALIFPGGFGAAKNLSDFAVAQDKMQLNADVERVLQEFHGAKKPIGLCCIAPVLAARAIPGVEVTVGGDAEQDGRWPYAGTAGAITAMGAKHVVKDATEAHTDEANRVVTSPAYMCNTELHHVFDSVGAMVSGVLQLLK